MSAHAAPLALRSQELAAWVLDRAAMRPDHPGAQAMAVAAQDLACELAIALTFPAGRAQHIALADEALVRLRTHLALAERTALLSARQRRYAMAELLEIGRMLGGWRKRWSERCKSEAIDA